MSSRALVVAAHPDDIEFGCAGTVCRWVEEGWDVRYVIVTSGQKGVQDARQDPDEFGRLRTGPLGGASGGDAAEGYNDLTAREREVLQLIAHGRSNKEIATELKITERTVKTHVSNIFGKLELTDRTQVALYAHKRGLADVQS